MILSVTKNKKELQDQTAEVIKVGKKLKVMVRSGPLKGKEKFMSEDNIANLSGLLEWKRKKRAAEADAGWTVM